MRVFLRPPLCLCEAIRILDAGSGVKQTMLAFLLAATFTPAGAAIVDNGAFTTDTESGLDWLDLSFTRNKTYTEALGEYAGWRLAENAEVETLFNRMFPEFDATQKLGVESPYEGHQQDVDRWNATLGHTLSFVMRPGWQEAGYEQATRAWAGYQDEDGIWRVIGVENSADGESDEIWGPEYIWDVTEWMTNEPDHGFGILMVRSTVVPVPPSLLLFGSALAGLGWLRERQIA